MVEKEEERKNYKVAKEEKTKAAKAEREPADAKEQAKEAKSQTAAKKSTGKIKFQYRSDLHLEHPTSNYNFQGDSKADYLLLGGDIGNVFAIESKKGGQSDDTNRQGLYN